MFLSHTELLFILQKNTIMAVFVQNMYYVHDSYTTIWTPGNFLPFYFLRKGWRGKQRGACLIWDSRPGPTQLSDRQNLSARTPSPFICWFCAWGLHLFPHGSSSSRSPRCLLCSLKKLYLPTCWFFSSVWDKWTLPERGYWGEQQNQHLTPVWSLWH